MTEKKNQFAPKQWEFITNSTKPWNLAWGSVRSGKTVCTLFRFMHAVHNCPDSQIFMVGYSSRTIYDNVIRLLLESEEMSIFRPFCVWRPGDGVLKYRDKTIKTIGAKDEGSIGQFQGKTMSLVYCDEMTLYPESIIDMIDTRLSKSHSMGIASMNPTSPSHKLKDWIDKAEDPNSKYYALHFTIEDNIFLEREYKDRIKESLSGVFYKRHYLGLWCLAEGSIFDFFDKDVHVVKRPPRAAEYYIASIDYGVSNAFACLVLGISTGMREQIGKCVWVENEWYWDCIKRERQLTNDEFADNISAFLEPYGPRMIYIDPSALAMKITLQKRSMRCVEANNDVLNGIQMMTSEMAKGNLFILQQCKNIIREIEGYVWDARKSKEGEDKPVKKADHAVDALRYAIASHNIATYNPYKEKHNPDEWLANRFAPTPRKYL
jgi:PBSX family phage terminase large subunit